MREVDKICEKSLSVVGLEPGPPWWQVETLTISLTGLLNWKVFDVYKTIINDIRRSQMDRKFPIPTNELVLINSIYIQLWLNWLNYLSFRLVLSAFHSDCRRFILYTAGAIMLLLITGLLCFSYWFFWGFCWREWLTHSVQQPYGFLCDSLAS